MLYSHYSDAVGLPWLWPNFSLVELSCRHCGEYYHCPRSLDFLQATRDILGQSLGVNSAHRCPIYNAMIGGAALSQHKKLALDLAIAGHGRARLFRAASMAGFSSFGFYRTFLHVDIRPGRVWYGKGARPLWNGLTSY